MNVLRDESSRDDVLSQLAEIRTMLEELVQVHRGRANRRESYSVEEVAEMLGKKPYTVREWCRYGRIRATKRFERRGGAELWSIPAEEVERYRNEGLLPRDAGPLSARFKVAS